MHKIIQRVVLFFKNLLRTIKGWFGTKPLNIISFIESPIGLGMIKELSGVELYPVQRFILKMAYNLPLDRINKTIVFPKSEEDFDTKVEFTEQEYLEYLYEQDRCNVSEQSKEREELVLSLGRRSGTTTLLAIISAYETYKLLMHYNPQRHLGVPDENTLQVMNIAHSRDSAEYLHKEIQMYFDNCEFFKQFKNTESQANSQIQTYFDSARNQDVGGGPSIRNYSESHKLKRWRVSNIVAALLDEPAFYPEPEGYNSSPLLQRIVLASTPNGPEGFFFEAFQKAMTTGSEDVLALQIPTWEANPDIPLEYLIHCKETHVDERFRREFGAEFV